MLRWKKKREFLDQNLQVKTHKIKNQHVVAGYLFVQKGEEKKWATLWGSTLSPRSFWSFAFACALPVHTYMGMWVYICMRLYITCTYVYVCICLYIHIRVYMHMYHRIIVCICRRYISFWDFAFACILPVYTYICICTYIIICTHTYT